MTVAYDASTFAAASGQTLTINHTPVGTPRAVIAFLNVANNGTDIVPGVTYGGTAMTEVTGSPNLIGGGNASGSYCYFLGASVPTGAQDCVFDLTASVIRQGGVITLTAADDTEVVDGDGTINSSSTENPSVNLSLGGRTSFAAIGFVSGADAVTGITPLANWNSRNEADAGANVAGIYTFDTIGSADVTAGWTQAPEAAVAMAVAVSEVAAAAVAEPLIRALTVRTPQVTA